MMEQFKLPKLNDCDSDINARWYVYYSYRNPETNKFQLFKKSISSQLKTKTSRYKQADALIRDLKLKLNQGFSPFSKEDSHYVTLNEALFNYQTIKNSILRLRSTYTIKNYIKTFKLFLETKKLINLPVNSFTVTQARAYFDFLLLDKKFKPRTYNNYVTYMRSIFHWFVQRNYINYNPFSEITKLQEEESSIIAYNETDMQLVSSTCPEYNKDLWLIAQLVFYTFIRPQEIVRLQVCDIHLNDRCIIIPASKSKNKKQQVIDIPDAFIQNLMQHDCWKYPSSYYIFSKKFRPGTFQIRANEIARAWKKYADKFELHHTIYALKHTGAGMAVDANINLRDLQLQLRHASLDQTMQYLNRFRKLPSEKLKALFPKFTTIKQNQDDRF